VKEIGIFHLMAKKRRLTFSFDRNGVVLPLVRAVRDSAETLGFALTAMKGADLAPTPHVPDVFARYEYDAGTRDPEERRAAYTAWLLSMGYQDLARATRAMLEAAFVHLEVVKLIGSTLSGEQLLKIRKVAGDFRFPVLLDRVNQGFESPLIFAAEMLSLQKVRNCLERRGGVVGDLDVDATGTLKLVLPTLVFMAQEGGKEVEMYINYRTVKETEVQIKSVSRERVYELDERIVFSPGDFVQIAHSCRMLADDLREKLPDVVLSTP
jgi:hypothetical protein